MGFKSTEYKSSDAGLIQAGLGLSHRLGFLGGVGLVIGGDFIERRRLMLNSLAQSENHPMP